MPLSEQQREHKRLTRSKNRKGHPLLEGRLRGVFYPDLVGKVPNYPRTLEIFNASKERMSRQIREYNAAGITSRDGVPNGWTRHEATALRQVAAERAKKIVDKMVEEKVFAPDTKEARIAMEALVSLVQTKKLTPEDKGSPLVPAGEVRAAAKVILEFAQRKPVTSSQVTVKSAEDWLDEIAGDDA
jgi:hypothetical protein